MTISFSEFFARCGKAFYAGNTILTAAGTTIEDEVEDFTQEFETADAIEIKACIDGVAEALKGLQSACAASVADILRTPLEAYLVELVEADNPQPEKSALVALEELIRQMRAGSQSVDASTPAASVSYGGSNVGTGVIVTSVYRNDGKLAEHILAEDILAEVTSSQTTGAATISLDAEQAENDPFSHLWPAGSGASTAIDSHTADTGSSLITNGSFEEAEDNAAAIPENWIVAVGTAGTDIKLTSVEVQTVAISGTPTGGSYILKFTNKDSKVQATTPLTYNATGSDVQSALTALVGLESVTVATTGTTPNFTHTITFTGVPNPGQLTSTSLLTGGTPAIAHATTTAGSANVARGARSLELDSDGSTLSAIQQLVSLNAETTYAVCLLAKTDSVPAAGVITVDLVDGLGGTVLTDAEGTNNSFTIDCTALTTSFVCKTGVFRTPKTLPATVYLRIRISTAISNTSSIFVNEVVLVEMTELYTDGLQVAAFTGATNWAVADTATIAVTNDRAGAIHEWFDRVFGLRENRLLLPSNTAGAETIADSLIS